MARRLQRNQIQNTKGKTKFWNLTIYISLWANFKVRKVFIFKSRHRLKMPNVLLSLIFAQFLLTCFEFVCLVSIILYLFILQFSLVSSHNCRWMENFFLQIFLYFPRVSFRFIKNKKNCFVLQFCVVKHYQIHTSRFLKIEGAWGNSGNSIL
jgi:hypothetical protein